ncbi:cytochrome P450 [Frigidibacter sp. MR17.24]|uniref:cytochrome P450 n=1 Tax=Frigidibacter sp. MR17.24 TaxID=3127345 RepID=UPI003012A3CC
MPTGPLPTADLPSLAQAPTDPAFVQDPYPFYDRLRAAGPLVRWQDYGLVVSARAAVVGQVLRDRRFGRAAPAGFGPAIPERLRAFYDIEDHSMLELDGPRHARLRGRVLRAFTSRRIAGMAPEIEALAHRLIDALPATGSFDLIEGFARPLPVIVIARLLGVDPVHAPRLLEWSNAMVAMYQARRSPAIEDAACAAAAAFAAFLRDRLAETRRAPGDDLLSALVAARENGGEDGGGDARLDEAEIVATAILLLNAGHEATVHTIGNAVAAILRHRAQAATGPAAVEALVEEVLRFDPPLHLFTRWVHEPCEIAGHVFARGDRIGCLLAAANRDPSVWAEPARFLPGRAAKPNLSFGIGPHFCLGAPLARLELRAALGVLFARLPGLRLAESPRFADLYHFHGLERLVVRR